MKKLYPLYYSPTGTTRKILEELAGNLSIYEIEQYDLTYTDYPSLQSADADSIAVIGVPVYGGRVPLIAVERLKECHGDNTPAVLVVTYGNRLFEDALLELRDIATEQGFNVIAAAAFIAEHSFNTEEKPIAQGRPDAADILKVQEFANELKTKIASVKEGVEFAEPSIPGNRPYKERKPFPAFAPETDSAKCTLCEKCAVACPTDAITIADNAVATDAELCTWCCACVKECAAGARIFENEPLAAIQERLFTNCSERREPEFFLR